MSQHAPGAYPPPPWQLDASAYVSVWRIRPEQCDLQFSRGLQPLILFGRWILAAGFASYENGSTLTYDELFVGALVHAERRLGINVPLIWVSSASSLLAGRELWGLPKDLAAFRRTRNPNAGLEAYEEGRLLARAAFAPGRSLPFRLPVRLRVVQALAGALRFTPVTGSSRVRFGRAEWRVPASSPLHFLGNTEPSFSLEFRKARIRFGA